MATERLRRLSRTRLRRAALLLLLPALGGCAAAVVTGFATGVVIAHDRRSVGAFVDDAVIEFKAESELRAEAPLAGRVHVNITSLNGIVLLTGEAPSAELRDRVLVAVRRVPHIRRIANEIRVAAPADLATRGRDGWISTQVKTRFATTDGLDPTRVKVVTDNTVVYLMGLVTRTEAELASAAAARVSGVKQVVTYFEHLD
jgi:osmotically-inducible protein OsmY